VVRLLNDRVMVKPIEEKREGTIVLPDSAEKKPFKGEVIAVGPGKLLENGKRVEIPLNPGDTVVFSKYGGTEIKLEGEEYLILRLDDILAKE
jgi:chaperonin GroES